MHPGALRTAALLTAALSVLCAVPATVAAAAPADATTRWSPDLHDAQTAGVVVEPTGVRLDTTVRPALTADGTGWTGLLTLPARSLDRSVDRVEAVVTGDVPPGSDATTDVRALRGTGGWTEWQPAERDGGVTLPESTRQVQVRLVLTGSPSAAPVVRRLDLAARAATDQQILVAAKPVLSYRVFATREGLVGGRTANGHVIDADDQFVALPSRRVLSARGTGEYTVRVCAPARSRTTGSGGPQAKAKRCAFAPVWDVGPWNTRDDYWNPTRRREEWKMLPQGVPQAQMAHLDGFNDGLDQYDRPVLNPAGIDLSDALFEDGLRLADNSWVTVDYLWTGSDPLATIRPGDDPVRVRAAPHDTAAVVGVAAAKAAVPARCLVAAGRADDDERWLKIGEAEYVPVAAAALPARVPECARSR